MEMKSSGCRVQVQVQDRQKDVARLGEGTNLTWLEEEAAAAGTLLEDLFCHFSICSLARSSMPSRRRNYSVFALVVWLVCISSSRSFYFIIYSAYACNLHFTLSNLRCFSRFDDSMILPSFLCVLLTCTGLQNLIEW
jgi:hypothetical protein